MAARVVERAILGVLVVVVAVQMYFAWTAYSIVQAQVAKITAIEAKLDRELGVVRAEAEARVKRVEDELGRIRRP
jgi:hypothetical protein